MKIAKITAMFLGLVAAADVVDSEGDEELQCSGRMCYVRYVGECYDVDAETYLSPNTDLSDYENDADAITVEDGMTTCNEVEEGDCLAFSNLDYTWSSEFGDTTYKGYAYYLLSDQFETSVGAIGGVYDDEYGMDDTSAECFVGDSATKLGLTAAAALVIASLQ